MTAEQIEKRYLEVSEKAREVFEEAERQREAVDAEIEAAKSMRERERRVARERMEANRKR